VRCEDVRTALPAILDGRSAATLDIVEHVESCQDCQAELARYRGILRLLQDLRAQRLEPPAGLLGEVLEALEGAAERTALRSALSGRRLAYGGAIGGMVLAGGLVVIVARRSARSAAVGAGASAPRPEQGAIV
jgi:predicted anti-sigma-YlaC factor YlaD